MHNINLASESNDNGTDALDKKIIFWENGKPASDSFHLFLKPSINTIARLIQAIKKMLNIDDTKEIKIYNIEGIEIDDIEVSQLKDNDILYITFHSKYLT